MTDILALITAEHARARRLFGALGDIDQFRRETRLSAGRLSGAWILAEAWMRLSALLTVHMEAEQEIVEPVVWRHGFGEASVALEVVRADHGDIRELLLETKLQELGSPAWWKAVADTRAHCEEHFDYEEQTTLAWLRQHAGLEQRRELWRRWGAFTTAWARDDADGARLPSRTTQPAGKPG